MSSLAKRLLGRKPSLSVKTTAGPESNLAGSPTSSKPAKQTCTLLVVGTETVGKTGKFQAVSIIAASMSVLYC